ncbi:hypothetical protein [Flavobacterium sp.]|uniref:hypothetical protein n=1 Tax=Flavobacterium sp. TaxID=239 RepID=UPI00286DA751|nr:hypothetical protein [Flavobacterium sp.]
MKKVLLSLAIVAVLTVVSCKPKTEETPVEAVDTTAVAVDTAAVAVDTAAVVADTTAVAPAATPAK